MPLGTGTASSAEPSLSSLVGRLQRLAQAYAALVVADARHAVHQVVELLCVAIVATVLAVTAWLALVVAVAGWMMHEADAAWPTVLAVAAVMNIAAAGIAGWWMWRQLRHPPLAATLRQIEGKPPEGESQ